MTFKILPKWLNFAKSDHTDIVLQKLQFCSIGPYFDISILPEEERAQRFRDFLFKFLSENDGDVIF